MVCAARDIKRQQQAESTTNTSTSTFTTATRRAREPELRQSPPNTSPSFHSFQIYCTSSRSATSLLHHRSRPKASPLIQHPPWPSLITVAQTHPTPHPPAHPTSTSWIMCLHTMPAMNSLFALCTRSTALLVLSLCHLGVVLPLPARAARLPLQSSATHGMTVRRQMSSTKISWLKCHTCPHSRLHCLQASSHLFLEDAFRLISCASTFPRP